MINISNTDNVHDSMYIKLPLLPLNMTAVLYDYRSLYILDGEHRKQYVYYAVVITVKY